MYSHRVTEQALYILASLARAESHGYGIARDAEQLSEAGSGSRPERCTAPSTGSPTRVWSSLRGSRRSRAGVAATTG